MSEMTAAQHRTAPRCRCGNMAPKGESVCGRCKRGDAPKQQTEIPDTDPDWSGNCEVCGESPILPATGLCGPCTFGEAETYGGNW